MKKILFTTFIVVLVILMSPNTFGQEVNIEKPDNVKIVEQIKRISKKVKKVEVSTKEMLSVLKKILEKKKKEKSSDFLNRVIK
tara:strand:+ start:572 stop:820 length:249 start_codon:yes stop_codon:yes gene_type:complete